MARILIIDDDIRVLETYCLILKHAGYEVVINVDGEKGIRAFRGIIPDLIITDIIMPEKDGFETIRELKREFPDVKIIAISGGDKVGPGNTRRTVSGSSEMPFLKIPTTIIYYLLSAY
jgi:DNA-binding response OmpR family regulator